jgi:phosphoserine aminotransferase
MSMVIPTGGIRASIYNAMGEDGVDALVAYMKEFEEQHQA